MANKNTQKSSSPESVNIPPVVAVLGHVDHGKTSLLDAIRKTNVIAREHGGITQGIGASSVEITAEGVKKHITFIDTPGHEAFMKMRGRGIQAADIALLVVSSADGVMPQTKESIGLLKKSKIPYIVVLTKSDMLKDMPGQEEKVKGQLVKEEVLLEGYGGDIPFILVSSKTGDNIKELLELIVLIFDMKKTDPANEFKGIVIESRLDLKSGPRATVVIKSGAVKVREEIVCEDMKAKIKTIVLDNGQQVERASTGQAVEILGFEKVPKVGSIASSYELRALSLEQKRNELDIGNKNSIPQPSGNALSAEDFLKPEEEKQTVSIVLCADNEGSLEAIAHSLPEDINIVLKKTGNITTNDILLAKSTGSLALGFNIKISPEIANFAKQEKVLAKNYRIIYELTSEIEDVLEGNKLAMVEEIYGRAKVLASFPFDKTQVLGIKVMEGRVARGDKVRLINTSGKEEKIVGESAIQSVRTGKNAVSKIEEGHEGGVVLSPFLDFTIGDMLICHG
jgi:translation initiation factor IF-2